MKILTANALISGDVVYWTQSGDWVGSIQEASLIDDEAAAQMLRAAEANIELVGAYLVSMDAPARPVAREKLREIIRAQGPTTRLDLGKQAESA